MASTQASAPHRLAHTFLGECVNRAVSKPAARRVSQGENKGNARIKVNDLKTTRSGEMAAKAGSPLTTA
jgi:hypothetical protein